MRIHIAIITTLLISACQPEPQKTSHPFIGCWETENGLEREMWTADPSGWLIGYALSRDESGKVTFFEHMRIERGEGTEVLVVNGRDGAMTRFTRRMTDNPEVFQFEYLDHDFPQIIHYQRNGNQLNAYISAMDGSNKTPFDKSKCKTG